MVRDYLAEARAENAKKYAGKFKPRKMICGHCGREFMATTGNARYCSSECKKVVAKAACGLRHKDREAAKTAGQKEENCKKTLSDWQREAETHDMTYGKYRAMLEEQERIKQKGLCRDRFCHCLLG